MDALVKLTHISGLLLQFWSAYVPCSTQHHDSVQLALEQIDLIRRLVNKHSENMVLVTTAEGTLRPRVYESRR